MSVTNSTDQQNSRKRKAALPGLDPTELERKRAISRRSSQRHRQREKIELEEYKEKRDALEDANTKLKGDNASIKEAIAMLRARATNPAAAQPNIGASTSSLQGTNMHLLRSLTDDPSAAARFASNLNTAAVAPHLNRASSGHTAPTAAGPSPSPLDLAALLMQKKPAAARRPDPPMVATVPAPAASQEQLLRALAGFQQSQSPVPSSNNSALLATLLLQRQQQQHLPARPNPSLFALGPAPAPAGLSPSFQQLQALALLQQKPPPVAAAPAPSSSQTTGDLLQELMARTAGNPSAQREIAHLLMGSNRSGNPPPPNPN